MGISHSKSVLTALVIRDYKVLSIGKDDSCRVQVPFSFTPFLGVRSAERARVVFAMLEAVEEDSLVKR